MQTIKTYKSQQAANSDMQRMAREGWAVQNQTVGAYRKAGCLGWLTLGIFNLFRKSKARDITVIYTKP